MSLFNALAIILHLVAINIWVGGMFFIIVVLGQVVATLAVPDQHVFWQKLLQRFFAWVWVAVVILLGTGSGMIAYRFHGLEQAPLYVLMMVGLALLMVMVFLVIYFVFYPRFKQAMQHQDSDGSRQQLKIIRWLGIVNMVLGLCVVVAIGGGPYWFY